MSWIIKDGDWYLCEADPIHGALWGVRREHAFRFASKTEAFHALYKLPYGRVYRLRTVPKRIK